MFYGFLDVLTGQVTDINAGHNPPALVTSDGSVSFLMIAANIPLGVMDDMTYEEAELRLANTDSIMRPLIIMKSLQKIRGQLSVGSFQ